MRIGSMNNVNLTKWQPNDQRDVFIKSIPGYNMPLSFDLNSSMRTHIIDGILADTSNASLAADMEYLESLFRTGQLVWLDATDQYSSLCSFGKIAKLQGPTIDASMGPFVAKFTMEFWSVPPWGTMIFNPWKQTGFKLRDIDGIGAEYMLDPTTMHCNYTLNEINQSPPYSMSWEFVIDNQNPFTNATSVLKALGNSLGSGTASSTNPIAINAGVYGNDVAFDSISIDSSTVPNSGYSGSLKGTKSSPAAANVYAMAFDFGSSGMDLSSFDRLRMWYRCDQASMGAYRIQFIDTSNKRRGYNFLYFAGANTWNNVIVEIDQYSFYDAGFNINAVRYIGAGVEMPGSSPPSSVNLWIADIRVENAYLNHTCDTALVGSWGGGTSVVTSNDTMIFKNSYSGIGSATLPSGASPETSIFSSIKQSGVSNTSTNQMGPTFPFQSYMDFTKYDFLVFWVRGNTSSGNLNLAMDIVTGVGRSEFGLNAYAPSGVFTQNQWYRIVLPLRLYCPPGGTNPPYGWQNNSTGNWTQVSEIAIFYAASPSITVDLWVSEISLENGNYAYVETMLPDNLVSNQIQMQVWNGSAYNSSQSWGTNGYASQDSAYNYTLDGTTFDSMYNSGQVHYLELYAPDPISSTVIGFVGNSGVTSPKTYSAVYGTNVRAIFAIKLPPATSDSVSGNYPSNDLSGSQAMNKIRIKIIVYFPNDDTTYSGFDSL